MAGEAKRRGPKEVRIAEGIVKRKKLEEDAERARIEREEWLERNNPNLKKDRRRIQLMLAAALGMSS